MAPLGRFLRCSVLSALLTTVASEQVVLGGMETTQQQTTSFMNSGNNASSSLPPIIMGSLPHWSHFEKMSTIAAGLVAKGYPVTYMCAPLFKEQILALGADFVEIGNTDCPSGFLCPHEKFEKWLTMPPDEDKELYLYRDVFVEMIPEYYKAMVTAMRRYNDVRTIMVSDASFYPTAPIIAGARGLKPHTTIGVGVVPIVAQSNYTYPYRPARKRETGANAKELHWAAWQDFNANNYLFSSMARIQKEFFAKLGARYDFPAFPEALVATPDIYAQLTIPEFEFERPDIKDNIEFVGIPLKPGVAQDLPTWWDEMLEAKKAGKKVVAVSTSSIDYSPEFLTLPVMEALKDRDDIFPVYSLVNANPELLGDKIPANAHIAKTVPHDQLLPHVSLSWLDCNAICANNCPG